MSTYVTTKTEVTDKRQVAEGEYVAGPDSVFAMPYSVALAEGAKLDITGVDAEKVVGGLLSNMDSQMAQLLGVQGQMAQGILEMAPKLIPAGPSTVIMPAAEPAISKNMIYIIVGIILFLFMRR